jgi:8-oxo-dGTP pyrophosphatase MutT (NUDIX family)
MTNQTPIRNAATLVLIRDKDGSPSVLMGQRGKQAAFMPSKFVFPGGAADTFDASVGSMFEIEPDCQTRLANDPSSAIGPETLVAAAIRELWEETGLRMARQGQWTVDKHPDWAGFFESGLKPDPAGLTYIFRAITPEGRPRRFDARFFVGDAERLYDDPDDFSKASDELSHLQWIPLDQTANFDLPFITQVVLAEVGANLDRLATPNGVPFYDNRQKPGRFRYI